MMSPLRLLLLLSIAVIASPSAADQVVCLTAAWPRTDFSRSVVPLDEVRPAGAARDEMPSVDAPRFVGVGAAGIPDVEPVVSRSEEHTSELQSLMRISYAVFCLKKQKHETTKAQINTCQKLYKHSTSRTHQH